MNSHAITTDEFRDLLRTVLAKKWGTDALRRWTEGETSEAQEAWAALCDAGLCEFLCDSDPDAETLPPNGIFTLASELGRSLFPLPVFETLAVAVPLLRQSDLPEAAVWLAQIRAGDLLVTAPLADLNRVRNADISNLLLLQDDAGLHFAQRADINVSLRPSLDLVRPTFRVTCDAADLVLVTDDPDQIATAWSTLLRGGAAALVGVSEVLLERTAEHVKLRHQFGTAVGAFQSVQHRLVDAHCELELARALTFDALSDSEQSDVRRTVDAGAAKLQAVRAARVTNREALQFHGAMGFSWENDLQFWLKHGKSLEHDLKSPSALLEQVAEFCLGQGGQS